MFLTPAPYHNNVNLVAADIIMGGDHGVGWLTLQLQALTTFNESVTPAQTCTIPAGLSGAVMDECDLVNTVRRVATSDAYRHVSGEWRPSPRGISTTRPAAAR